MEVRYRIYPIQVHDYCEKCAIWIEPEDPSKKVEGFNYVTREEMDAAKGYIESDEHEKRYTADEIINILDETKSTEGATVWLVNEGEKTKANVKFFGEMVWTGHVFTSTNKDTGENSTEYAFICNNPACKHEKVTRTQYPVVQQVEGRAVRDPSELALPDQAIRDKMTKKHVGSTVLEDAEVEEEK